MHLDVCLYVENCVLLGLDWVEPMMHFFCTSHVHAFFMHMYPLLFFCLYSIVIINSLSLADSLCMAPKHKSTLPRNPLRSRTSSSNPTPLHIPFRDEKARKYFSKNFSNCGIHSECHVVLSDFSDIALPIFIHN